MTKQVSHSIAASQGEAVQFAGEPLAFQPPVNASEAPINAYYANQASTGDGRRAWRKRRSRRYS